MARQVTAITEKKIAERNAMLFIDVPAKFILELASGMREPDDLAAEYGFTPNQWNELKEYKPFIKAVDDKKSELQLTGYTFRMKAHVLAEELLDKLGVHAHKEDASFHTTLECVKFASRAAGIDAPVREEDGKSGNTINITIDLGSGDKIYVEQKLVPVVQQEKIIEDVQVIEIIPAEEIPYDAKTLFEVIP